MPDKKPATKVASLKKLLNKNIKLNSHVKFDEEGDTMEDSSGRYSDLREKEETDSDSELGDSIVPVPISEYETGLDKVKVGGIKISRAQQKISERDKVDKKLEMQRIKQAHRERRLKKCKRRTQEDTSGQVVLDTNAGGVASGMEVHSLPSDSEDEVSTKRIRTCQDSAAGESHQLGVAFEPVLKDDEELAKHLLGL